MRRLYLADQSPGDVIDDVYVLTNKQFAAGSNGKNFIKAFVSDKSMQVTARMWNATRDHFTQLTEGFIRIRGHIENYQNNLQLIIEQFQPAKEGTFELADLIPHTSKNIPAMHARLREVLGSIQNRHLCALVHAYLDDKKLMESFCRAPAAMSFHHAYLGGLLEHTLNTIEVAEAICRFYAGLNRDLVIAGLFLHDIAKTWELTYECSFSYSDGGQLVGHIVKSAIWVEHKRRAAEQVLGEQIPQNLIDVIQHIILSHHGPVENAFGSARTPSTPEAMMVHFIDEMDAKVMLALQNTRGPAPAGGEGLWTEYLKAFAGRLYRPDVAPADAELTEEVVPDPAVLESGVDPANLQISKPKNIEPAKAAERPPVLNNPLFEIHPAKK